MEEFSTELHRVMPVVTRVARRFAPEGEAEDSIQEACLAAWRYRHRFNPDQGSFQTWLLKILINESHKLAARRQRNGSLFGRLTDRSHLATRALPEGADGRLEALITRLPRRQREVIGLHYFVDLPVQEVADLLGISAGTVKSTLSDARRTIEVNLTRKENS